MIRKWLKLNSTFVELLKNPSSSKSLDYRGAPNAACSKLHTAFTHNASPSCTTIPLTKALIPVRTTPEADDLDDAECSQPDPDACTVAGTPAKTELFEIKGPSQSAFLIEVHPRDLEDVKKDLVRLKGDFFHFDKAILEWFTLKCILAAEPFSGFDRDQIRLAKVHAISSGSEEVYVVDGVGKFFFVNSVENTMRTKKILEKLGYKISGVLYRFQPKERTTLEERYRVLCYQFLGALEQIPKVISVTHNL